MHVIQEDTIYPCPFSRGYGIPRQQAWVLLKIFFFYRIASAGLLLLLFALPSEGFGLGKADGDGYELASMAYLGISLLFGLPIFRWQYHYGQWVQLFIFTDVVFVPLLMHASGGVSSGLGALLAVSVAAGGVLVGGRCAMLFAALSTLAVLAEQFYAMQISSFSAEALRYSGMLGGSFFTIGLLAVILAQRVEQSASLARSHEQTIVKLEELNRYIIQHLQSGIMIIDSRQTILLSNQSLLRLLDLPDLPGKLGEISGQLQLAFMLWKENPQVDSSIITLPSQEQIQVRFSQLMIEGEMLHMLLFEDVALYNQRLQQGKLASLGRLTASIAHEIRNPLSAISHAGQLLSETPQLDQQERRLTEIIQNHCLRVNKIIEDVLALSRRNPSRKQRIEIDQWLPAYVQEQNALSGAKACFSCAILSEGLYAYADPDHLKQILDNLCSNALKYGLPELGAILLEADCVAGEPCIFVSDNGPGISVENQQHLFEPFFTTSHQGTGLGLYLSRELAELNQADLSYGQRHHRSCFHLSLLNADHAVIEI